MLNKKSFDLNKDENQVKTKERLYQPRKFRWCKFIVAPLLIGFILLLILTNVDFTGKGHNHKTNKHQENSTIFADNSVIMGNQSKFQSTLSRALNCIQSTYSCSLTCGGGNVNNIYKQLEPLYKSCNRDLDLLLIDCSFPASRLKEDFFQGNYRLRSVNISNCNLGFVQNNAFDQESVKNLTHLTLTDTKFVTLDNNTFKGLQQLEYFEMINKKSWSTFRGEGFLKYFAETLKTLILQQEADADYVYDPLPWLQGAKMNVMTSVNLANNNFQNLLSHKTFLTLISVKYLDLSNCSLNYLAENVFDSVLQTLKYLNLSHNHLSTLSGKMLWQMTGVQLDFSFNFWQCTCENKDMLQFVKNTLMDVILLQQSDIRCYEPAEWKDRSIRDLKLECLQSTTLGPYEIATTKIGGKPETTSTTSASSREISESSDSYSNDSSSQTSEEKSETPLETTTKSIPTTSRTTTSMLTPIFPTSTTTRKPTTKIPAPKTTIYCHVHQNDEPYMHPILEKKFYFSILRHSATSVKIVADNIISSIAVIFFTTPSNYTILTNIQRHEFQYSAIINNLNSSAKYVFCLVQELKQFGGNGENYNWNISPFDCRSFSQPEILPKTWLEKEDQVWIISLVVLGACLMVLLSIILIIIVIRYKKRNKRKRTLKEDVKMEVNILEAANDLFHQKYAVIVRPPGQLYVTQYEPPDVVAEHFNYNLNYNLYEELEM